MKSQRLRRVAQCLIGCAMAVSMSASAYNWGPTDAKVTVLEPSFVGTQSTSTVPGVAIWFQVDQQVGNCPAGTWLSFAPYWFGGDPTTAPESIRQQSNTKAILSTLQMSITLGTKVRLYGFNMVNSTCQISNAYSLNI